MPLQFEKHNQRRKVLRIVGPCIALVGLVFIIIGITSFFIAFGTWESPRYFWCAFVGAPILAVGLVLCQFGYMGSIFRFYMNETIPVGTDAVNYMVDGTKGSIHDIASAISSGLRDGVTTTDAPVIHCHKCHAENDASANFCKSCASPISKAVACTGCGHKNAPDARFCDKCGQKLSS